MSTVRKSVIYALILMLPMSSWASVTNDCGMAQDAVSQTYASAISAQQAVKKQHVHQHRVHNEVAEAASMDNQHQHERAEASSAKEDCCNDCLAICATSLSSFAAIFSPSTDQLFAYTGRLLSLVADPHVNPPLQSLFRPPIS